MIRRNLDRPPVRRGRRRHWPSPAPAQAGLLPVSVSVQPEAGNFRWTYSVVLPTDMKLQAGNYFTIYDFGGYIAGSANVTSPFPDDAAPVLERVEPRTSARPRPC